MFNLSNYQDGIFSVIRQVMVLQDLIKDECIYGNTATSLFKLRGRQR